MKELKKELTIIRNKLYDNLPTGEVDSFNLITIIKLHLKELDLFIDQLQPLEPDINTGGEKIEEVDNILKELKDFNPYPESVFTPIPQRELKKVIKLLRDNGYSTDCLWGNWGRAVWSNCVKKAEELFEEFASQEHQITDEIKSAIKFILDNPNNEDFIASNIQHSWNEQGWPNDNSITLDNEWMRQHGIILEWLRDKLNNKEK